MTLHIAHVLHSLAVGGTEQGAVNLINTLGDGFQHTVISMTDVGRLGGRLSSGVAVHSLGKRPGTDLAAVIRLCLLLRRLTPGVVHSRNWGSFDAVLAARLAGVRVVIHAEHGREASDPDGVNPRRNRLRRLLAPMVDHFVTVSEDLRRWLLATVRIPARKVTTIHNGVDVRRFSEEGRRAGSQAFGLSSDLSVIGTVGRLNPVKDHLGLIEAFARLDPPARRAALVIVGDGPCRAALEARARRPDVAGRVHLLGERFDIPTLLKRFDVFVLPSIAEGISNTILEAMATGLPVVATRTGGNPELVEEGVTGRLVPVGDHQALARALAAYIADPNARMAHGRAGRRRAAEEFTIERMASRYRQLYRSLVDPHRHRSRTPTPPTSSYR